MNGYQVWSDAKIVCIVTGFGRPSANVKTGPMLQAWILVKALNPIAAVSTGLDKLICGNCPARGKLGKDRICYVNLGQAPLNVWNAWKRGAYPPVEDWSVFDGRAIRLGAYGDPAFVPVDVWNRVVKGCSGHTGYSHAWRTRPDLKHLVMASCDSVQDRIEAEALGWRTFRMKHAGAPLLKGEISCPASKEAGNKTTCSKCQLCNGSGKTKSIAIDVHGSGQKKFG